MPWELLEEPVSISREKGRVIYRVRFKDHAGTPRYMQGFRSKTATRVLEKNLQNLVEHVCAGAEPPPQITDWINLKLDSKRKSQLVRWGIIEQAAISAGESLEEKVITWELGLLAEGCRQDHAAQQRFRASALLSQFETIRQIEPAATRAKAMALKLEKGWSDQTTRHYLSAAKSFTRWAVKYGHISRDPLAAISIPKIPRNRYKRQRMALERREAQRLVEATQNSEVSHARLSGQQRALLYELALETGYRATAIYLLAPENLRESSEGWWIAAPDGTRKRTADVPIPESLARRLLEQAGDRLIQGPGPKEYSRFLKFDCREAGIREIDFHTFRHTRTTWMHEAGVDVSDAKELLGHRQISTTVDVYKTVRMGRLFSAAGRVKPVTTSVTTDENP